MEILSFLQSRQKDYVSTLAGRHSATPVQVKRLNALAGSLETTQPKVHQEREVQGSATSTPDGDTKKSCKVPATSRGNSHHYPENRILKQRSGELTPRGARRCALVMAANWR